MTEARSSSSQSPDGTDDTVPHSARIWNYWLGGKDNYPVDRVAGEQARALLPEIVEIARASRGFLGRAVRYLAGAAGVRQFLDIGTGLPTVENTHEVAQQVAPESQIVYVDNDPMVLLHARALLVGTREGATDYVHADARDPETVLREAARTLDFSRPIAVMMLGILPFIGDDDVVRAIVDRLMDAVPAGSFLAVTHSTSEVTGERVIGAVERWNRVPGTVNYHLRSPAQIGRLFAGMELVEPGVVPCPQWRPEPLHHVVQWEIDEYCAVGKKP